MTKHQIEDNRETFEAVSKVFGLFNNHNGDWEIVGFAPDGTLTYFAPDKQGPVSVAQSVEIIHRLEKEFCDDGRPTVKARLSEMLGCPKFKNVRKEKVDINPVTNELISCELH